MFYSQRNPCLANSIAQLKETYRDHPCMTRVNALKEQLKQEKIQDKAFYQSRELQKTAGK